MPKVTARVLTSDIIDGKMIATIRLNGSKPKQGDLISVKWGRTRSSFQNNFYWLYLTFLWKDCRLRDEYNTVEDLHEAMKATFLSTRVHHGGMTFIHVKSTTTLDKIAMGEYMNQIDKAMVEYHHCATAPFWQEYKDTYSL